MVGSGIQAADAVHAAIANLRGASEALCNRATLEGDYFAGMLSESLTMQADKLSKVEQWLERDAGERR